MNDEIELEIAGGVRIVATITSDSTKRLGLAVGKRSGRADQGVVRDRGRGRPGHAAIGPQPARWHGVEHQDRCGQCRSGHWSAAGRRDRGHHHQ
ncbi:TOBE domain-containing protein [Cupriavidus basilensis]